MVRVSIPYITRKGSQNAPKHGRDTKEHVKKLTHLFLNDQFIDGIGDISECKNLKVLYLQGNLITVIENLHFASALTHLYLQGNKLCKIQGLDALYSLQKLYLGHNCISVVEGLDRLKSLRELHIEHQQLPSGEELMFDPRSIVAIGQTLKILNLEDNSLSSLEDLVGLEALEVLNIANNNLTDVTKIQAFLATLPCLIDLNINGNPVTCNYKNCDKIIASTNCLCVYNGKVIPETTLVFMKKLESRQTKLPALGTYNLRATISGEFKRCIVSVELAHDLPEALAKDVTSSILKNEILSKDASENGMPDPEQALDDMMMNAPYYHFPAFKSSTCLQFEGHTIPRQFQRLAKRDPLTARRHHSTNSMFPLHDNVGKQGTSQLASKQMACDTYSSSAARDILGTGDMVWKNH